MNANKNLTENKKSRPHVIPKWLRKTSKLRNDCDLYKEINVLLGKTPTGIMSQQAAVGCPGSFGGDSVRDFGFLLSVETL